MKEAIGWICSIAFTLSTLPQLIHTIKTKKAGITWGMLWLLWVGCLTSLIYINWNELNLPLFIKDFLGFAMISVIIKYKLKEKDNP